MLSGLAALSGCSWLPFSSASSGPPAASCPSAAILRPLAQTAVFAPGAARQPMGVAFYGILSDVEAKCEPAGGALRASLDVVIVGERGPAGGKADGLDVQYFVAVTGPDQAILSKRSFPVHIAIPADSRRAGVTDHIEETIPLTRRSPGEINIVLGWIASGYGPLMAVRAFVVGEPAVIWHAGRDAGRKLLQIVKDNAFKAPN
jgi:hypothetical protein